MKKHQYILSLALLALLAAGCDRDDQAEIFPEEYFKILYIKDSGIRKLDMNTAQDVVSEPILVIKGGAHPEMEANGKFEVLSLAEAADQWNFAEESYSIIPEGSYKLPDPVSFTKESPSRQIEVELYPLKMSSAMREKPDNTWILPLRLTSDSASVNKESSNVLINCSVVSPVIRWADENDQAITIDYKTLDYPVGLMITRTEINKAAFTGKVESLGDDAVDAYNAAHGTNYPLLPRDSYSIGEVHFAAGELSGSATLNLSRTGLTGDVEYLLPVKLVSVSSELFELSGVVKYYIVGNPRFAFKEVEPAAWKIAFCNSEDRNSEFWAQNMFNRDPMSNFCSYWNANQQTRTGADVDDFRYPSEGSYPGTCSYPSGRMAGETIAVPYPCCDGVRKYNNLVVVIDLGETVNIHSIGISKMAGSLSNLDLKGVEFYTEDQFTLETAARYKGVDNDKYLATIANYNTADAGNNWRLLMRWEDIPRGNVDDGLPTTWNTVPLESMNSSVSKGRFLKIHPTASYRSANCIEICDLHIRKLITIDGEPAE